MIKKAIPLVGRRRLIKSGSSVVVTVPVQWLLENGLGPGDDVIVVSSGNLVFMKLNKENAKGLRDCLKEVE